MNKYINNSLAKAVVDGLDLSTLTWTIEEYSGPAPHLADFQPYGTRLWKSEEFKIIKVEEDKYDLPHVLHGEVIAEGKSGYFRMESGEYKMQGTVDEHYGDMLVSDTERRKDSEHCIQSFSIQIYKNVLRNILGEKNDSSI